MQLIYKKDSAAYNQVIKDLGSGVGNHSAYGRVVVTHPGVYWTILSTIPDKHHNVILTLSPYDGHSIRYDGQQQPLQLPVPDSAAGRIGEN